MCTSGRRSPEACDRLPGNVFDEDETVLVDGGIYVERILGTRVPWLYVRDEDGDLIYEMLPRDFRFIEGSFWRVEPRPPDGGVSERPFTR